MVSDTDGAATTKRSKTQIRADRRRRKKAAERGPDYVAPVARVHDGPPTRRNQNVAKRLRTKALKAACKAAGQATKLVANAASPSQEAAFRWQKGRMGVPKLEPTLPAAQRMAAAQAVLSSLPSDQLLKVVTPQVDVSRHGAGNRGTKHARDAKAYSTGQSHTPTPTLTPTKKSRRLSSVEITRGVGKQLPQGWRHEDESASEDAVEEEEELEEQLKELLAMVIDKQALEDAPQQWVHGGGLAPGTHPTASAMEEAAAASSSAASSSAASSSAASSSAASSSGEDEAAAAELAEATPREEAAAPEAEAAAAATDEAAVPEAVAAAMQEAAAPEAAAIAIEEAAALEAGAAAINEATFAEAVAVASVDEAEAPEASLATTSEAAVSETSPSVAKASQAVSDMDDEAQSIVQQTSSKHRADPSSLVELTADESQAAALGVEMGADVERFPDLCALQGCVPETQATGVLQEAAYGSLAPIGPGSTPAGPGSAPAGPGSTPVGPGSTPAGLGSTPAGPDNAGPDSTPPRSSGADDDLVLDIHGCSQSNAYVTIPLNAPAASLGPSTTAIALGVGSEQDGEGAKSGSPSMEPQASDVAADTSSAGATLGMTTECDGGDGTGPCGLATHSEVIDLTGLSEDFAQVDDPLREVFQRLECFLEEPDLGPLTMDNIGAMKAIQDEAFGDKAADKDIRLVYHLSANVAVFRRDILCMKVGSWMRDEIVNIYMALLQDRDMVMRDKKLNFPKCYFFNTFFFCKLYSDTMTYSFDNVRSQVNAQMVECDKLICPVHQGKHWTCAVADYQQQTITYYDSLWSCRHAKAFMHALLSFVDDMGQALGKNIDICEWRVRYPEKDEMPKQNNGCDCGVFALLFAEYASRNAQFNFKQRHINAYRTKIVADVATMKIGIPPES